MHEETRMKKTIKFISLILTLITISCCLSSCVGVIKALWYFDDILEYMQQTPQNKGVAYMNGANSIYFHDKVIQPKEEIVGVLYVTADHIYYVTSEREGREKYARVYKSNYDYSEEELILSYEVEAFVINMPDEDKIYYKLNGNKDKKGYYVRYISENRTEQITEEQYEASWNENDYYSVKNIEGSWSKLIGFEITNKVTGETKLFDEEDLNEVLKIEQAKKLNEYYVSFKQKRAVL